MKDDREGRALGRVIRLDLVIALSALLISSLATIASFWQTVVVQKQLSAAVLPYVEVQGTFGADEVKLYLENVGVGPAIIKDAVLRTDGVVQRKLADAVRPSLNRLKRGERLAISTSDLVTGQAIRSGDTLLIFDGRAVGIRDALVPTLVHGDLTVCYCSILDQCWSVSHDATTPAAVPSCKTHDPDGLQPVEMNAKFRD